MAAHTYRAQTPRDRVHRWLPYLLVLPLVVWIGGTVVYPLISSLLLSFTDTGVVGTQGEFVGLANYAKTLRDPRFWRSSYLSLVWVIGNGAVQTLLAFATALLLNRRFRGQRWFRAWIVAPWVIPTAAVAAMWSWMLSGTLGVISYLLRAIHLIDKPLNLLGATKTALATTIFVNSWHWFPLMAVILLAALQTIPGELYEASAVDGASPWQQFWAITLPSLRPVLNALGLVGTLWSFGVFDIVWLLTKGGPSGATRTLPVYIYEKAFKAFEYGEAAAVSVLAGLFLVLFAFLFLRSSEPAR